MSGDVVSCSAELKGSIPAHTVYTAVWTSVPGIDINTERSNLFRIRYGTLKVIRSISVMESRSVLVHLVWGNFINTHYRRILNYTRPYISQSL